ncbi:MAG: hypothetical protein JSR55_13790 [Proteobacteria bacterium]|nr:hypothetical protein [Pseudomonadota bacterium]
MQDALNYAHALVDFFKAGFTQVNYTLAVIVALYWAWRMSDWSSIVTTAIGAVIMHLVAIILAPVIDHNGPFGFPPYQSAEFWRFVAALFLGYTAVIGVLFFLKSLVLNRGSGDSKAVGTLLTAGAAAAVSHGTDDHHGGGHDDHGHGGGHDDHGHGGGHDDHGHGGGHDDHGHGGGHNDHGHGGGHDDHGHGGGHNAPHGHH